MSSQNSFMSSKKDDKGKNIQVVVRCRPFNQLERKASSHSVLECDAPRKEVCVRTGGINDKLGKKTYTFDMVFGPAAKQIDVYRSVVCPILDEVIMGYNCTVFAYGQTGTGKTFTMEGERSADEEFTWEQDPLAGIIPRTLHQIFEKLSENGTEFSVKVSLLEIYNEELFDLLSPSPDVGERLQMFDDPRNKRGVIIKGLEEVSVHNKDEVYHILERGAARRKTASTLMNAYSSRSHSVFSVTIHMKETTVDGEELVKIGKLNLVDLAGSENIGRSGAVDKRAREAGNINQSLLTLGRVITALVERAPHIPYRESKLTRILQDSLGGRTKTSIIATVSPASINLEETVSTLEYANRAKNIMNKPEVNQKLTKRALIKEYTEEIERLKRDLATAREKNGVYLSNENYEQLQGKVLSQEEIITEYTEKITAMEEEIKRINELFAENKKELEECTTILQCKEKELEETQKNLHESKEQLAQEAFVVTALETTEKKLHGTANKLLTTVRETSKDVSGLHAKLDRKRAVDQHNTQVHENFAEQMNKRFSVIERSVDEYSVKQQGMLDFYTNSIDDLLGASSAALSVTATAVAKSFTSVQETVSEKVSHSVDEILKQETLSSQAKDDLQKLMAAHRTGLEQALRTDLLPVVTAVLNLNSHLSHCLQNFQAVADKIDSHKEEMNSFFTEHSRSLHRLRLDSGSALSSIQSEYESLKVEIETAQSMHSEGVNNLIGSLQNQLNLLAMETQQNFSGFLAKGGKLQKSVGCLQQDLDSISSDAIEHTSSHHDKFAGQSQDIAVEIRQLAASNMGTLEESSKQCEKLTGSINAISRESQHWCESASQQIDSLLEEQVCYLRTSKKHLQSLQKDVEVGCGASVVEITEHVNAQRQAEEKALTSLVEQVRDDKEMLGEQRLELHEQVQSGQNKVNSYLNEELRNDVPTGTTPQRRDYVYPSLLVRTKPRDVLLEQFRQQQQEYLESISSVISEAVEPPVEQDSLEDEPPVAVNDSVMSEKSCIDLSMVCQENGGVPFFQQKKALRKEKENRANTTLLERSKIMDEAEQSLPKSKLPLRMQN
ncbi:kinesin-like protein KIF11 [Xenopus tropicalis]|uniref:kinesin-like protein KIF11 n=1 Tax=Xenopus tropicalis TaxID=8364 RepID=UPI00004D86CE|nr:kinesin-like protein KIF11 [Xenopus tropicalis]ABX55790.1 Costal2 [Xenopus tropicalis]ABX55791.1 Costal2 [Xenopus tropicalis]|eukprot:NP_001016116.2 kinesin-like protein KIF11 [Xenopus tropicalis]